MKEANSQVASRMLHGAFILTLASVLSKLIGTLQKVPLQNMGGDVVFGIYNTVYPLYSLVITLAMAGFPVAISKFVAENDVMGNDKENRRILKISSMFIGLLGIVLGMCTYVGAPLIAKWIDNTHVISAIRYVSIAFLFIPIMSLLRGFFQGHQNMVPTAVSQIVEQSVRVTVMIVLLLYLTSKAASPGDVAAGALFGSAAGGAAGLMVMLLYWIRYRIRISKGIRTSDTATTVEIAAKSAPDTMSSIMSSNETTIGTIDRPWTLLRKIVVYAIPICLASLAVPLMNLVDTFTVPRLLKSIGLDDAGAMIQFGVYNRGIPLVQLVTLIATSLSVMFIPALAEAKFKGDKRLVQQQCRISLRWFWIIGLAASVGLCILAEPINIMLYKDAVGTDTMRWISFTAVFSAISLISAALLQGIGVVRAPAVTLLVGALAKVLLNLMLVPQLGITGAAIAGVAAHFLAAMLNVGLLVRNTGLNLSLSDLLNKPVIILAGLVSAAVGAQWIALYVLTLLGIQSIRIAAVIESLSGVAAGAVMFIILVVLTKLINEEELRMLPKIGNGLAKLLKQLHVLR